MSGPKVYGKGGFTGAIGLEEDWPVIEHDKGGFSEKSIVTDEGVRD